MQADPGPQNHPASRRVRANRVGGRDHRTASTEHPRSSAISRAVRVSMLAASQAGSCSWGKRSPPWGVMARPCWRAARRTVEELQPSPAATLSALRAASCRRSQSGSLRRPGRRGSGCIPLRRAAPRTCRSEHPSARAISGIVWVCSCWRTQSRVVQLGEGSRLGGRLPGGMPGVAKRLGHSLRVDVEMGGDAANGPAVTATAGQPFRVGELGDQSPSRCKALVKPGIAQGVPDPSGVDVENGGDPLYRPALVASGGEPGRIGELGHVAIEAGRETGLSQRLTDPSSVDTKCLRDPLGTPPFAAAGGEPVSVLEFGDRSASDHLWNRGLLHRRGTTRPRRRVNDRSFHRQPGMWTRRGFCPLRWRRRVGVWSTGAGRATAPAVGATPSRTLSAPAVVRRSRTD